MSITNKEDISQKIKQAAGPQKIVSNQTHKKSKQSSNSKKNSMQQAAAAAKIMSSKTAIEK